jgi:DNA-binding beta-propeller fold protein YncE
LAFTKDDRYLLVSRMKGGGISFFDLKDRKKVIHRGAIFGITPGPRDLQLSPDGKFVYIGCNSSGYVRKVQLSRMLSLIENKANASVQTSAKEIGAISEFAGLGVRSIKVTHSGDYIFAAVNQGSELQAFRTSDMKLVSRIPVDSYPVGLAVSPDDSQVWVTSQGRQLVGGNSVGIFQVKYSQSETISISKDPRNTETQ